MPQKLIGLIFVFVLGLATAVVAPPPATAVPAGLNADDWNQIQMLLSPTAINGASNQAKLTASDGAESDNFGVTVAVVGDTAVIGAPGHDGGGAAYIFTRHEGVWSQQTKLTAGDDITDSFGASVALAGDTAVIGSPSSGVGEAVTGHAYVFIRVDAVWSQQAKLTPSDSVTDFGGSVDLDGDTAVIGATEDDDKGMQSGAAYVFVRTETVWSEQAKLTASDGESQDYFGGSVAVSGDTVIIGAGGDDDNGEQSGSVYVFTRTGAAWSQQAKLLPSDGATGSGFGNSVALAGDTAVIGAPDHSGGGAAYIFTRDSATWSEHRLTSSDSLGGSFGIGVAIDGDTAVIGAYNDDSKGTHSGAAYLFTRTGTTWRQHAKLIAADGAEFDYFGYAVAVSGDTALISSHLDDDNGNDSGSAYVFIIEEAPLLDKTIYLPLIARP